MSQYRSAYLGGPNDPEPVFCDEHPDAHEWLEGAVMAVTFTPERFGHRRYDPSDALPERAHVEFYGVDGWPLELPAERKARLGDAMKLEFQICPWGWRHWDDHDWWIVVKKPTFCRETRFQSRIASHVAGLTAPLETR